MKRNHPYAAYQCRCDTVHTVDWLADNIYVHFCVQLYTVNIFLKICF